MITEMVIGYKPRETIYLQNSSQANYISLLQTIPPGRVKHQRLIKQTKIKNYALIYSLIWGKIKILGLVFGVTK